MKLSQLLASRSDLLRKAFLANTAHAYATLAGLSRRIALADLHGPVRLLATDPAAERFIPQLIALRGNQSVLDEHFDEGDLLRLADALAFFSEDGADEFEFRLEELCSRYATPLRDSLASAGVELDEPTPQHAMNRLF